MVVPASLLFIVISHLTCMFHTMQSFKHLHIIHTCPEVHAIKSIRAEIIPNADTTPSLPTPGRGREASSVCPTDPELEGSVGGALYLINRHLVVPFLVDGVAFGETYEDVGSHTVGGRREEGGGRDSNQSVLLYFFYFQRRPSTHEILKSGSEVTLILCGALTFQ